MWGKMNYLENLLKMLMLSALVLPLFAQESDNEDEDEGLEVVITTATKTEKIFSIHHKLLQL